MDEFELLRSLRPEVEPPTAAERDAMWRGIGAVSSPPARRDRRGLLVAAVAATIAIVVLVVGGLVVRSRGTTVQIQVEDAAPIGQQDPDPSRTAADEPAAYAESSTRAMSVWGGDVPPFGWSTCGATVVTADELAASSWAVSGRATGVAVVGGSTVVVTVAVDEWLRGSGDSSVSVSFPFVADPFHPEQPSGWIFGTDRVLVAGLETAAASGSSPCEAVQWWTMARGEVWRSVLR